MTFDVRASCVALRRCGSSRALPETQCLHQERNTTYVSSCLSSSSTVSQGVFRALATGASSLSGMTGSADGGASCLFSSIRRVSSNLFNLFKVLFSPQRHHALHPTSPAREIHPECSILTLQIDPTSRIQWCLVAIPSSLG